MNARLLAPIGCINTPPKRRRRAPTLWSAATLLVAAFAPLAIADSQWTEPTDVPALKVDQNGVPNREFQEKHQQFLARGRQGPIGLLFLGDSITADWTWANHPQLFDHYFAQYHPANFGIGADRTEHVLWRLDHGELDAIHPKVVVLLIGTNNIGWPAADIARGVTKIVSVVHQKLPDTKVLLLGIFPRGADPKDHKTAEMREKIRQVNASLAKLDDGNKTRFLDIGDKFLSADATIAKIVMPDALHPDIAGLAIWADAMQATLEQMMK